MIEDIIKYIENFDDVTRQRFCMLYELIYESTPFKIDERVWAKLPSFYVGNEFIRVIPFKDHLNIEAKAILSHNHELSGYKVTPNGKLQIFNNQNIPDRIHKVIF